MKKLIILTLKQKVSRSKNDKRKNYSSLSVLLLENCYSSQCFPYLPDIMILTLNVLKTKYFYFTFDYFTTVVQNEA